MPSGKPHEKPDRSDALADEMGSANRQVEPDEPTTGTVDSNADSGDKPGLVDRLWDRVESRVDKVGRKSATSALGLWFKRTHRPSAVEWALLVAVVILSYIAYMYGDARITLEHSFNFLDSLLAGNPRDFYEVAIDNSSGGHPAVYDIPIYIVFGLWNLPSYLFYRFGDLDPFISTPALMWMKLMMVAFMLASAWLIARIIRTLGGDRDRSRWASFYFLTALTLFVPVLVIVQYDIVAITFTLAGLHAYLRRQTGSFLMWFTLACMFKLFALFAFIPLVLLREKRLVRAVVQLGIGLSGVVIAKMLYLGDLAHQLSTGAFNEDMIDRLSIMGIEWQTGVRVPLFVVLIVGLAIFAYTRQPIDEREIQAFAIYLPLVAYLLFVTMVPMNPYWIALVAPFLILATFASPRYLTLNSILEISFGAAYMVVYMLAGYSMWTPNIFNSLILQDLLVAPEVSQYPTPGYLLMGLGIGAEERVLVLGFMFACAIALAVVNYPRPAQFVAMPNSEQVKRSVAWVRLGVLAIFSAMMLTMLIPAPPTLYSSGTSTPISSTVNLLTPGTSVEEDLTFDQTFDVDLIRIGFDAGAVTFLNQAVLTMSLTDSAGSVVLTVDKAVNSIETGQAPFEVGDLTLVAGETYTLRLVAAGPEYPPESLFVQLNEGQDKFPTTGNDGQVSGDLVVELVGEST